MQEAEINTQIYTTVLQFVPSLHELDVKSTKPGVTMGARAIVQVLWFQGKRDYRGSPTRKWPSAADILHKHGNVKNWAAGVTARPENTPKADLADRFNKLLQMYHHI